MPRETRRKKKMPRKEMEIRRALERHHWKVSGMQMAIEAARAPRKARRVRASLSLPRAGIRNRCRWASLRKRR